MRIVYMIFSPFLMVRMSVVRRLTGSWLAFPSPITPWLSQQDNQDSATYRDRLITLFLHHKRLQQGWIEDGRRNSAPSPIALSSCLHLPSLILVCFESYTWSLSFILHQCGRQCRGSSPMMCEDCFVLGQTEGDSPVYGDSAH